MGRKLTLDDLLERAKHRANIESDYALAKAMGIDRRIISDWRNGRKHPNNEECVQLATLAALDEMQVIAAINLQFATNEKKKDFWKHYIESRGATAILMMAGLALAITLAPHDSDAAILQNTNSGAQPQSFYSKNIYYAHTVRTRNGLQIV
jgi:hypothetical protein